MEIINSIIEFIDNNLMASVGMISMVLEFIFRLIKSDKPKSIVWVVRDFIDGIGRALGKIAELLDKVLPQRLNSPEDK